MAEVPTNNQLAPPTLRPSIECRPELLPPELREHRQWVVWQLRPDANHAKPRKVPINARDGREGKTNSPTTWSTYDDAAAALKRGPYSGVGFVFTADDPFCGIDLDGCIDEAGAMQPWAQAIVQRFNTYTEISQSGRGVKLLFRAVKPAGSPCRGRADGPLAHLECYDRGRYFALTGRTWPGTPMKVEARQGALDQLIPDLRRRGETAAAKLPVALSESSSSVPETRLLDRPSPQTSKNLQKILARASRYLARMPHSVSGEHGHDHAYAAATVLVHGFELDQQSAFDLLTREFSPRCDPPWSEKELWHKIEDAATKPHDLPRGWLKNSRKTTAKSRLPAPAPDASRNGNGGGSLPAGLSNDSESALPVVLLGPDEHRVIDETIASLTRDENLYQRGEVLVRIVNQSDPEDVIARMEGSARIDVVPDANLRDRLTSFACFKRENTGVHRRCHPTAWLVKGLSARASWPGIRRLLRLSEAPVVRPDGTLFYGPGYDGQTGVLVLPSSVIEPLPERVTRDDAWAAVEELLEVVAQFPFEHDIHRAAFLAALLSPLARSCYSGPTPLFLIDANSPSSGKGLLVRIIAHIVLGRELAVAGYVDENEEMRKQITSLALAGDPMVMLDNVDGTFGNAALDRALTSTRWQDRLLGRNQTVSLPLQCTWYATGNNVVVGADTMRRIVHVRLRSQSERPDQRTGFKYPEVAEWVLQQRSRLLRAALMIMVGYLQAGKPRLDVPSVGSFEGWSGTVRQGLLWAGQPDPCLGTNKLRSTADPKQETLRVLLHAWKEYAPVGTEVTCQQIIEDIFTETPPDPIRDPGRAHMRSAIEQFTRTPHGKIPTATSLGNRLRGVRDSVCDGFTIRHVEGVLRRGSAVWQLCDASAGSRI